MITMETRCPICQAQIDPALEGGLCPACLLKEGFFEDKTQSISPDIDELNATIDDYEFVRFIGRGGMGAVYEGVAKSTGKTVALKVLLPELAKDPTFVERLKREALTMARLAHPNIVPIFHYGQQGEFVYLALNYVEGTTLDRFLASREVSEADLAAILVQIAKGLQYAHNEGIIHRDLKPQNVLVRSDREALGHDVYLADFGLAKLFLGELDQAQPSLTGTHQVFGTARYMSPEQLENSADIDQRSDYFSLAVMLYEILTEKRPLGRFESPENIALERYSRLAKALNPFILQSLHANKDDRPADLTDLVALLESLRSSETPTPKIEMKVKGRRKKRTKSHRVTLPPDLELLGEKKGIVTPERFIFQMMISAVLLATTFMDWIVVSKNIPFPLKQIGWANSSLTIDAWHASLPLLGVSWPVWIIPAIVWLGALHGAFGMKWPVKRRTLGYYNLAAFLCMMVVIVRVTMIGEASLGAGSIIAAFVSLVLSFMVFTDTLSDIRRLLGYLRAEPKTATGLRSRNLKRKLSDRSA